MAKRTPIPKSVRFEVFKRDKFTCQYCGASAPDVILEIDHIMPVSKGGTNDIMNLVTSCRDCNRGKKDKALSDNSAVKMQKQMLDDRQERRDQLAMMLEWRESLEEEIDQEIDYINDVLCKGKDWYLNDHGRKTIRKLIRKFGFNEVCEACYIALDQYDMDNRDGWQYGFNKIGGICFNRQKARDEDA